MYIHPLFLFQQGAGTNDRALIRVMVTRCEVDMVQIKQEFHRLYKKTLESFIEVGLARNLYENAFHSTEILRESPEFHLKIKWEERDGFPGSSVGRALEV